MQRRNRPKDLCSPDKYLFLPTTLSEIVLLFARTHGQTTRERGVVLNFQTRVVIISNFWRIGCDASRCSVLVATTVYETAKYSAENKNSETREKKRKLCLAGGVLSQSRTNHENYMVDVRDFVCKQTLTTNEIHSYVGQTSVLANQLVQKLCACTMAQVPSTVVQRLALDRLRQLFSPNPLVWKMDPGVKAWFSLSLRRNGKEHRRIIREWSMDKMMSNWTTDDKLNLITSKKLERNLKFFVL